MLILGIFSIIGISCKPNEELRLCRCEIEQIADRIDLTLMEHPEWSHIFTINNQLISQTLYTLGEELKEKFSDCPCTGSCTTLK